MEFQELESVEEVVQRFKEEYSDEVYVLGAGAIPEFREKNLFILEKKEYWTEKDGVTEISYQNVGGAVEEGETPLEACRREAEEELDCGIEIKDSEKTFFISEDGERKEIELGSGKRPVMISKEKHPGKPGRPEAEGEFHLLGFLYRGRLEGKFRPSSEIAGCMVAEKSFIQNNKEFTIKRIKEEPVEIIENYSIPENSYLYPKFSAKRQLETLGI